MLVCAHCATALTTPAKFCYSCGGALLQRSRTPAQRACRSVHRAATPRSLDFDQDRSTGKLSRVSHSPPAPAGRL